MARPAIELPTSSSGDIAIKVCQDRFPATDQPRDVTLNIDFSKPFNQHYEETRMSRNMLGTPLGKVTIQSGQIYVSVEDGGISAKRLILEIGCSSVVYILINKNNGYTTRVYVQSINGFFADIYTRVMAKRISDVSGPVATFVKFEMNFLIGMFSTIGFGALAAVVGADITYLFASKKQKVTAAKELADKLLAESESLKGFAPTLQGKIYEFYVKEKSGNWVRAAKNLPMAVVTDDRVRARFSGILFGYASLSPSGLTTKVVMLTILSQSFFGSIGNAPKAYKMVIDQRYMPIIKELNSANWLDPNAARTASAQLSKILNDTGVKISPSEAKLIGEEITRHPTEIQRSINNLAKAFKAFNSVMVEQ